MAMDSEQIASRAEQLPIIGLSEVKDGETWEGDDMGTHFRLSHHTNLSGRPFFSLSVWGKYDDRDRLIEKFSTGLGTPVRGIANKSTDMEIARWDDPKL